MRNNSTTDIWNDDDGEDLKPRGHGLRNFFIFFLTLAAVLLVVLAAAWRDGTGLDVLRRYFTYGRSESGSSAGYLYDASANNRFALLGSTLVVLSETALTLTDGDGDTVWSTSVKMENPAIATGGGYAVAYDVGGMELYVVDAEGLRYAMPTNAEEPYIAATLNASGHLAVTAKKQNHKAVVSVYDGAGNVKFTFYSSERFVANAYATDDGNYVAAAALGQSGGGFASSVVLYDLTAGDARLDLGDTSGGIAVEPVGTYVVGDGVCLDMGEISGHIAMVCDNALAFSAGGEITGTYSYSGSYLREYDLHGENYAVLLLNRYQSGSVGRLVTVDPTGQELASLAVSDEILSVSAAGRYIAVLYADRLVVYNPLLEQYASLMGTEYARGALAGADGSALLLAAEHATRFLP